MMEAKIALERIAFLMETQLAESYKVQAFRKALVAISSLSEDELHTLNDAGRLKTLKGIGKSTEAIIQQCLAGRVPDYLTKLEATPSRIEIPSSQITASLRGDCHTHSDWSDGGSSIEEMARTGRDLGREYMVLTDHSPRLTIANGLTAERLLQQFEEIDRVNKALSVEKGKPFKLLKGIEVDILDDGSLDQSEEMLSSLDVVVASLHSDLRASSEVLTKRMLKAVANPHTNILGHCTGRKIMGRQRPPSSFDAEKVFKACVEHNVAVEINSRPERKDPPLELLQLAADIGCLFSIDSDAHAPGQLAWLPIGAERAEKCGINPDRIINTMPLDDLLSWAS